MPTLVLCSNIACSARYTVAEEMIGRQAEVQEMRHILHRVAPDQPAFIIVLIVRSTDDHRTLPGSRQARRGCIRHRLPGLRSATGPGSGPEIAQSRHAILSASGRTLSAQSACGGPLVAPEHRAGVRRGQAGRQSFHRRGVHPRPDPRRRHPQGGIGPAQGRDAGPPARRCPGLCSRAGRDAPRRQARQRHARRQGPPLSDGFRPGRLVGADAAHA